MKELLSSTFTEEKTDREVILETEYLCLSLNSYASPIHFMRLNPQCECDGIWRWRFGKLLGNEGRALVNGINALAKQDLSPLVSSAVWGHREKIAISEPGNELSPDPESFCALILDFLVSKLQCSLVISHVVYGIFVTTAQRD